MLYCSAGGAETPAVCAWATPASGPTETIAQHRIRDALALPCLIAPSTPAEIGKRPGRWGHRSITNPYGPDPVTIRVTATGRRCRARRRGRRGARCWGRGRAGRRNGTRRRHRRQRGATNRASRRIRLVFQAVTGSIITSRTGLAIGTASRCLRDHQAPQGIIGVGDGFIRKRQSSARAPDKRSGNKKPKPRLSRSVHEIPHARAAWRVVMK
ncbi:hypothetical protein J2W22_002052 [Sphingomonas kyeonggiensis]|nr:hypothetical protein [Sphingomonas kyeonggiensis]